MRAESHFDKKLSELLAQDTWDADDIYSCINGRKADIKIFYQEAVGIKLINKAYPTPGWHKLLRLLFSKGFDPTVFSDRDKGTLLYQIIFCAYDHEFKLLAIASSARVDVQNAFKCTALMLAVEYCDFSIVEALVAQGADLAKQDYRKKSVLDYALLNKRYPLVVPRLMDLKIVGEAQLNALSPWSSSAGAGIFANPSLCLAVDSRPAQGLVGSP